MCNLRASSAFEWYDLTYWLNQWGREDKGIAPGSSVLLDGEREFRRIFWRLREIRNLSAHGVSFEPWMQDPSSWLVVHQKLSNAVRAALVLDDGRSALEMEIAIQQFGLQISREEAIWLLEAAFLPSDHRDRVRIMKEFWIVG